MILEGPLVCDDALGAGSTSPFELCKPGGQTKPGDRRNVFTKPGDRRNVFRFCPAVTPPPAGSAPVPGTVPSSLVAPPGAPRADVPTQFPDASRSSRNLARISHAGGSKKPLPMA